MRPGIGRIRGIFDYEKVGGSPLLGVRGHGHHHPRPGASGGWSTFACEVAATTARTGVPALIAEALAAPAARPPAAAAAADAQPAAVGAPRTAS